MELLSNSFSLFFRFSPYSTLYETRSCLGLVFIFRIIFQLEHPCNMDNSAFFHTIHLSTKNVIYFKKISNIEDSALFITWIFLALYYVMDCLFDMATRGLAFCTKRKFDLPINGLDNEDALVSSQSQ